MIFKVMIAVAFAGEYEDSSHETIEEAQKESNKINAVCDMFTVASVEEVES